MAKRLAKTPAWVSQRLALLELTPQLQEKVEAGELKLGPARRIGRMPKARQAAEVEKTVDAVNTPAAPEASSEEASPLPEPRTEPGSKPMVKMPWHDGAAAMDITYASLTKDVQRHQALARYIELAGPPKAFAVNLMANTAVLSFARS
ncbi:hypothetical protein [Streptomyces niveus]|uniref:hypothetical protein n=1 Tax=Streptomyces niveus TaxID=193462 RepID=UPI00364AA44D